ncbi:MAG: hypothetical protein ACREN7_00775 [Candidatus Dormibacteria bacterium]
MGEDPVFGPLREWWLSSDPGVREAADRLAELLVEAVRDTASKAKDAAVNACQVAASDAWGDSVGQEAATGRGVRLNRLAELADEFAGQLPLMLRAEAEAERASSEGLDGSGLARDRALL